MTNMNLVSRREFLAVASAAAAVSAVAASGGALLAQAAPTRLKLRLRRRKETAAGTGVFQIVEETAEWDPGRTAIIICDMWDLHHCKNATDRVGELAPTLNRVVAKARAQGVFVIHAPSSCMAAYADTPARRRALEAPRAANLPSGIGEWCSKIPAEDAGKYPIDQSDGGCDTEPGPQKEWSEWLKAQGRNPGSPWLRQIDAIEIRAEDAVSDSGVEIWNLLEARGLTNVMLTGVHTNMCVLGRPFGLRQMAKNGKNTILLRDMTDTMYNPAMWPHVNHFAGTELIVEHIEKFVCATATSASILGGKEFRFKGAA